jgi:hypothetical protein
LLMRLFLCCWWLAPIHSPLSLLMHHLEILWILTTINMKLYKRGFTLD